MGGMALKLVNKLARRSKYIKERERGNYDKENKLEQVLQSSPRAYELSRQTQRRLERNFGQSGLGLKPVVSFETTASSLTRTYYSSDSEYGMQLTLPMGLQTDIGLQPGDWITILNGQAIGQQLQVIALTNSTQVQLTDYSSFSSLGLPEIEHITAVADVSGSLNNKYFYINSADNIHKYYVWYDVNSAGTDPAIVGRTGLRVNLATGALAATVASSTVTVLNSAGSSLDFTANNVSSLITVTNKSNGATTLATDTGATGFTIAQVQAGTDASQSSIVFRAFINSVKSDFTTQNV